MKNFKALVVCEEVEIFADSEEQAEEIYNAFQLGEDCPRHSQAFKFCDCAESVPEVSHTMEYLGRADNA